MADGWSAFKVAEKTYQLMKSKPSDFSAVIDLTNVDANPKETQARLHKHPNGAVTVDGLPGWTFLPEFLAKEEEMFLANQCLRVIPELPNDNNLRAHHKPDELKDLFDKHAELIDALRWSTIGFQYQWSERKYNNANRSEFPPWLRSWASRAATVAGTNLEADTAICNYYKSDSRLGGHLDDVELDHSNPLVAFSVGCTAIFLAGYETRDIPPVAVYLRGRDVVVMDGPARLSYHGVPRVLEGTWPGNDHPHHGPHPSRHQQSADLRVRVDGASSFDDDGDDDAVSKSIRQYLMTHRANVSVRRVAAKGETTLPEVSSPITGSGGVS